MRTVVLFKEEAEEYRVAFKERGFEASFVETLEYEFVNEHELRAALLEQRDALVVTSARGVQAVSRAGGAGGEGDRVYAVGEASARAVQQLLGVEARGADAGEAGALARRVAAECGAGATVLWARGQRAETALQTALEASGLRVRAVVAYSARPHWQLAARLHQLAAGPAPAALCVFSGAGAELVLQMAPSLCTLPLFAIGRTTARGVLSSGAPVSGVAAAPTAVALADVVHSYFLQTTL